jgi:hypothetical protein
MIEELRKAERIVGANAMANRRARRAIDRRIRKELGIGNGAYTREAMKACNEAIAIEASAPVEIEIGRITVIGAVAGNSRVDHARIAFKIDGKRASRAKVEALLAEEEA